MRIFETRFGARNECALGMNLLRWHAGWRCEILRAASSIRGYATAPPAADGAFHSCVLQEDEGVGHAGYVVGDGAGESFGLYFFVVAEGEFFGLFDPVVEERGDDFFGFAVLDLELRAGVEGVVEVALLLKSLGLCQGGENGEGSSSN